MKFGNYNITEEYCPPEDGNDEQRGKLILEVTRDDEDFEVPFQFVKRGTAPSEHTPFPRATELDIYAWPRYRIPEELKVDPKSEDNFLDVAFGVPHDLNLLQKPYSESDGTGNPFFKNTEE